MSSVKCEPGIEITTIISLKSCRFCLANNGFFPIHDLYIADETIKFFFDLETEETGFPNSICFSCFERIQTMFNFKTQIQSSTELLKNIFQTPKEETVDIEEATMPKEETVDIEEAIMPKEEIVDIEEAAVTSVKKDDDAVVIIEDLSELDEVKVESKKESKVNGKFTCEKCIKTFTTVQSREIHFKNIHLNVKPFHCNLCIKKYCLRVQLRYHMKKTHGILSSAHKCIKCQTLFATSSILKKHLLSHSDISSSEEESTRSDNKPSAI